MSNHWVMWLRDQYFIRKTVILLGSLPSKSHYINGHCFHECCVYLWTWEGAGVGFGSWAQRCCGAWMACTVIQHQKVPHAQGGSWVVFWAIKLPVLVCRLIYFVPTLRMTLFDPSWACNFRSQTARKLLFICPGLSLSNIRGELRGKGQVKSVYSGKWKEDTVFCLSMLSSLGKWGVGRDGLNCITRLLRVRSRSWNVLHSLSQGKCLISPSWGGKGSQGQGGSWEWKPHKEGRKRQSSLFLSFRLEQLVIFLGDLGDPQHAPSREQLDEIRASTASFFSSHSPSDHDTFSVPRKRMSKTSECHCLDIINSFRTVPFSLKWLLVPPKLPWWKHVLHICIFIVLVINFQRCSVVLNTEHLC